MTEEVQEEVEEKSDLTKFMEMDPAKRGRYMATEIWHTDDLGFDLTIEESLFVRSYLIDRNEVASLKRLGYDLNNHQLKRMAKRYLAMPEVQAAVEAGAQKLMDHLEISAEKVNQKIAHIAFTDVTEVLQFDGLSSRVLPSHLWPEHARTAIKGIKHGQFGLQIDFHDKHKALDFLAKQTGLSESEEQAETRRAEAAADAALLKMMTVVQRAKEISSDGLKPAKVIEHKDDSE